MPLDSVSLVGHKSDLGIIHSFSLVYKNLFEMRSSFFVLFVPFLCQLVIAIKTSSSDSILVPVSDDGWDNSIRRRSAKDSLKLLDSEHMVWNSPPGKQPHRQYTRPR
jgi:hypothetical protein